MSRRRIENEIAVTIEDILKKQGIENPGAILLEIPRNDQFGDLSSNAAMIHAKRMGTNPRKLADSIASVFPISDEGVQEVTTAGPGFLNFRLTPTYYHKLLRQVLSQEGDFGSSDTGDSEKWHFEFVSANPTGPLNIVNARAASIGDTLVGVFRKCGFTVHSEYYVNDGGGQIRKLGASLLARLKQLQTGSNDAIIPDGGYQGEYLVDIARDYQSEISSILDSCPAEDVDEEIGRFAAQRIQERQRSILDVFGLDGVKFDRWFFERELFDAADPNYPDESNQPTPSTILDLLVEKGLTYNKDGALYFQASRFGDSEDRVVRTSEGRFTYIVPDIAYHLRKHKHYDRAVNLLGPDHHGHILQLRSALKALIGDEADKFFNPIIVQQVNLKRGGEEIKMSKRAGVGITMRELIDDVGDDAARFFFLRRKITSHLDFDIDLARSHTDENPVYYVQYAHARIKSILRQPDAFDPTDDADLALLKEPETLNALKNIARFPWTLNAITRTVDPHPLTTYLIDLAKSFHQFYTQHRVISEDKALTGARLALCKGVAIVLVEGLRLMGVRAPERM